MKNEFRGHSLAHSPKLTFNPSHILTYPQKHTKITHPLCIHLRYPAVIVLLVQTHSDHRGEDVLNHPVTDPLAE